MKLNWIDIILFLILLWTFFRGYRKNLDEDSYQFLKIILVLFFGIKYTIPFTGFLEKYFNFPIFAIKIISFILIFILVFIFIYSLRVVLEKAVSDAPIFENICKIFAGILSSFKALIIISLIVLAISFVPLYTVQKELKQNTNFAFYIISTVPKIIDYTTCSWDTSFFDDAKNILRNNPDKLYGKENSEKEEKKQNNQVKTNEGKTK